MKKQLEKESRSVALGTAIIVIAMVIVFGAVFAWMYSMDLLFLPDFAKDIFGISDDDGDVRWDLGALSEIVKSERDEGGEVVTFDVTYENLRAAFLSEEAPEGLYLSADVSYYADGEASTRRIRYYRDGDRFRTETYAIGDSEMLETLKIANSEHVTVIDRTTGESRTIPRTAGIYPENEAGIPSVDTLLSAIEAFPEMTGDVSDTADTAPAGSDAAETSHVTDCELRMVRTDSGNVYYIAYTYKDLGLREEYYVSLDYRIIISANTTLAGKPVYSYKTVRIATEPEVWSEDTLYTMMEPSETAEE